MPVSIATIQRLPQYLRILKYKKNEGIENISSTTIANELKLNSIQVRKDLALISRNEGKPKVGFNIKELIEDIENFLGLNNSKDIVVVGAGRLGQALMNYKNFENDVSIIMAFDKDIEKCNGSNIFHINKMKDLIKRMNIHIAIIAVPKEEAQEVCDTLVKYGIKAIWNFAQVNLKVPDDVVLKNEDLSASLSILLKKLKEKGEKE